MVFAGESDSVTDFGIGVRIALGLGVDDEGVGGVVWLVVGRKLEKLLAWSEAQPQTNKVSGNKNRKWKVDFWGVWKRFIGFYISIDGAIYR